ncbi:F-box/kelch-repeat protein At3g23880-like [Rhododendron vialii]|uniref:F-box/kelch-repeat protein At3g23880-like n=1 Tax=Rhododendron vialii TaxID=182163 RepID=UPI00265E4B60|nr:F-box/kelch-repeat protein At3g23880-like [Rhododendron vialii]
MSGSLTQSRLKEGKVGSFLHSLVYGFKKKNSEKPLSETRSKPLQEPKTSAGVLDGRREIKLFRGGICIGETNGVENVGAGNQDLPIPVRKRKKKNNTTSKGESCPPNIIIPEDIVVEILSRLPLESLPRFTCVSKRWRCLISTISATKKGSPKVLLASYWAAHSFSPHSINQHQQEACGKSVYVPWAGFRYPTRYLGSCNGLLLMGFDKDLFLWNPLTRFFKKMMAFGPLWGREDYRVCSGLCYDSTGDDYKAILSLGYLSPYCNDGEFVVVVSFRNKSWSIIDFPFMISTMESGPIVNAKLHWFASKNDSGSQPLSPHQIIYFDAHVDKFGEVAMPEPKRRDGDIIVGLGVLDECLCMSRWDYPRSNVEVLVMKHYGVKKSWTILFAVSDCLRFNLEDRLVPLGYTKYGEVLAMVRSRWTLDWHISAFNPTDSSHRIISTPKELNFEYPIAYDENLITPTGYDWEEEES